DAVARSFGRQIARRHARTVGRRGAFQADAALERPVLAYRRAAAFGGARSDGIVPPQRRAAAVGADKRDGEEKQHGERGRRVFREHVLRVNRSTAKSTVAGIKLIL